MGFVNSVGTRGNIDCIVIWIVLKINISITLTLITIAFPSLLSLYLTKITPFYVSVKYHVQTQHYMLKKPVAAILPER